MADTRPFAVIVYSDEGDDFDGRGWEVYARLPNGQMHGSSHETKAAAHRYLIASGITDVAEFDRADVVEVYDP